jgi:hypothetical protein
MGSIRAVSNIEQAEERFSLMMMLPGNNAGVADGDIRTEELGWHALTFLAKGNCPVEEAPPEDGSRYERMGMTNTDRRITLDISWQRIHVSRIWNETRWKEGLAVSGTRPKWICGSVTRMPALCMGSSPPRQSVAHNGVQHGKWRCVCRKIA